jgi:flavorubredoxin
MSRYAVPEIADNIFAVGSIDWKRRLFDALAPTPIGTTYNSYLVRGTAKNALIDTVHPGYETELSGKIDQILGSHAVDYVIMNHAEPDHAGLIPYMLQRTAAKLVTTKKGGELARAFYKTPTDRIQEVKDGDTIDLGGKTLRFIPAPFLHWPETMFTYLAEDKVLFSCDFFGAHNTTGVFDDQADDTLHWAKKYYGEIFMPLAKMGRAGMEKIKSLDIGIIAPSHGPVYRRPKTILDAYAVWTSGKTEPKVLLVYVSMYRSVETIMIAFAEALKVEGVKVHLVDLAASGVGELAGHLVDTRALVLGTPTVLGAIHPLAQFAMVALKTLRPPLKYAVIVNSYGWGKGAIRQGLDFLEEMKVESAGTVEVNGVPGEADYVAITTTAKALADKVLADDV